jgi:hypothetical protein
LLTRVGVECVEYTMLVRSLSDEVEQLTKAVGSASSARGDHGRTVDSPAPSAGAAEFSGVDAVALPPPSHSQGPRFSIPPQVGFDVEAAVPDLSAFAAASHPPDLLRAVSDAAVASLAFGDAAVSPIGVRQVAPPVGRLPVTAPPIPAAPPIAGFAEFTADREPRDSARRQQARDQMLSPWQGTYGFQDSYGYIVDRKTDGAAETLGEATLHTAIAAVAIATGNVHQDPWEKAEADRVLGGVLDALTEHSWGNPDGLGRRHPIRHPDVFDYAADGTRIRNSPLTKDSFGAIVAACYYAYTGPHSSDAVRTKARALMAKWIEYLVLHQWRLHSSTHPAYFEGEFECKDHEYVNIFSDAHRKPKSCKDPDAFLLVPHEVYALKSAGAVLGLNTAHISPWGSSLPVALRQTIVDVAAPYLAGAAAHALELVLSSLTIRIPYSVAFGGVAAGWPFGELAGEFVIDVLPDDTQRTIVEEFRNALADAIREVFRLTHLGQFQTVDLIGVGVDRILDRLPDSLGKDSWRTVLTTAMQQLAGWLRQDIWIEAASVIGALHPMEVIYKPDVVSFTMWSVAVECETNPAMTTLLKPFLLQFWAFLRGRRNANGLWAWLVDDTGRVEEQLTLFETSEPTRWDKFAYGSTPFDEWRDKPPKADIRSPRLDHLVLDGLYEKGGPPTLPETAGDWWDRFVEAARQAADNLVALIREQFTASGRYVRELVDAAGTRVREMWEAGGRFTREIVNSAGRRVQRLVSQLDGAFERWSWAPDGVFHEYARWQRLLPDGSTAAGDLVELLRRGVQGELEKFTWSPAHALESYRKWWRSSGDGAAAAQDLVEAKLRDAAGQLTRTVWNNDHVLQSYRKWWRSAADGSAAAVDVATVKLRSVEGTLEEWTHSADGAFEGYGRWARSTIGGAAEAVDMVERKVRDAAGLMTITIWSPAHVFESYRQWWRSAVDGSAVGADLVERKLRDAGGVLTRSLWSNDHVFLSHRRWWRSATDGAAAATDIAMTQLRDAQGVFEQWQHRADGSFESYGKWWQSNTEGAATAAAMVESRLRDAAGVLTISTWSTAHVYETYRKWWQSAADGSVTAQDLVERRLRDAGGALQIWTWSAEHVFLTYRRWNTSAIDGTAQAADLAITQVRDAAGELQEWLYETGRVLQRYGRWWRSPADGTAAAADMVERLARDSAGELKKWIWDTGAVFRNYWRWARSTTDGSALAADLRERLTVEAGGNRVVESWNDAGQYAKSVFDAAGKLVGGVNIPLPEWPPRFPDWRPPW